MQGSIVVKVGGSGWKLGAEGKNWSSITSSHDWFLSRAACQTSSHFLGQRIWRGRLREGEGAWASSYRGSSWFGEAPSLNPWNPDKCSKAECRTVRRVRVLRPGRPTTLPLPSPSSALCPFRTYSLWLDLGGGLTWWAKPLPWQWLLSGPNAWGARV